MKPLTTFQEAIGYVFKTPDILQEALTHKSFAFENREASIFPHNERLEFLGDAVLDLAVSELLMHRDFAASEGVLSKRRATLVNEATLADVARQWNLQDYLRLGQGELASEGKHKSSILSSALEAVLGAVFLDGGLVAVTPVVERLMGDRLDRVKENLSLMNKDFKTLLQEAIQNKYKTVPKYEIDSTQGPEHRKEFKVSVYIQERKLGEGKGLSRKEAEQNAAQSALEKGNL